MEELARLAGLATAPPFDVGTRVFVREDGYVYISVGNTRPEIRDRLGWTQGNVWMRDHVELRLPLEHPEIATPVRAMAYALGRAHEANLEPDAPRRFRFVVDADWMRNEGLVESQTMKYVDVIVELRTVDEEVILRGYHLAPTRHGPRGVQLWP